MEKSDSDATSLSDEDGFAVPKRLFPAEIADMLFTSEAETDFTPEIVSDNPLFQSVTASVGSAEHSDDRVAFGESSICQTMQNEQHTLQYTATNACQLLMDSSCETSADEQSSLSTSSSDPIFDLSDPDANVPECNDFPASLVGQNDSYVIDNDYKSLDSSEVVSKYQPAKVVKSVASRSTRSTSRAIRQPGSYISDNESSDSSEYSPTKVAALKSNRSCTSKMAKASASNKCTRSKSSSKSKKNLQLNQRKNLQLNQGKKSLSLVRTILVKKMRLR